MEPFRISGIDIHELGVFDKLSLKFSPEKPDKDKAEIHIFTGPNGAGKSTLLQALSYFDFVYNKAYWNPENTVSSSGSPYLENNLLKAKSHPKKLSVKNTNILPIITLRHGNHTTSFPQTEAKKSELQEVYYNYLLRDFSSARVYFFAYSGNRFLVSSPVETFKETFYNPLTDALDINRSHLNPDLFQWIANTVTRYALALSQGSPKASENYRKVLSVIEKALSGIIGKNIEFVVTVKELQVVIKVDGQEVNFNQLADGYKSIITWLVDLIFRLDKVGFYDGEPKPFVLFLDEIDAHLHPQAQRRILPTIQSLFPTAQIFLTTHSPFVIGSVDGAWVYKLNGKKNAKDGKPIKSEDGKSYKYILMEIFDTEEEFGINVMTDLAEFYSLYKILLKTPDNNIQKKNFLTLAKSLAAQSIELQSIITHELRQLARATTKPFSI